MPETVEVKRSLTIQPSSWKEWAMLLLSLAKIRISLLATLTTAAGYLLATGQPDTPMLLPTAAVFLLAFGSCGLNQYQERAIDASMERTRGRVLPAQRLPPRAALTISLAEISSGSLLLLFARESLGSPVGSFRRFLLQRRLHLSETEDSVRGHTGRPDRRHPPCHWLGLSRKRPS